MAPWETLKQRTHLNMLRLLIQRHCEMVNVCCFSWGRPPHKCTSSSCSLRFPYFCPAVLSARNVLPHPRLPSGWLQFLQKLAMHSLPEIFLINQAFPFCVFLAPCTHTCCIVINHIQTVRFWRTVAVPLHLFPQHQSVYPKMFALLISANG